MQKKLGQKINFEEKNPERKEEKEKKVKVTKIQEIVGRFMGTVALDLVRNADLKAKT